MIRENRALERFALRRVFATENRVADWRLAAWTCLALAGGAGLVRSGARFTSGVLPLPYVPHAILLNAAIAAVMGIGAVLLVFAGRRLLALNAADMSTRTFTFLLAYVSFWILTSSGFAALFSRNIATLTREMPTWGPGAVLYLAAGLWLSRGKRVESLRRCAALALIFGVIMLGTIAWSRPRDTTANLRVGPPARSRPPVIVVLVDTLRADHLSTYGYEKKTSPTVDRFALEGIRFTRAFAQSPWTRPSCGALFTARLPPEIGLRGVHDSLHPSVPTMPEFLKAEGYATAGVVSSVHVSAAYGFERGFDHLDSGPSSESWAGVTKALVRLQLKSDRAREGLYPRYNARELTDRAIQWLDRRDPQQPFFLYLHYSDPHAPYRPEEDRWREFVDTRNPPDEPPSIYPPGSTPLPPEQYAALVARYDAEIAYFDHHFGRLLTHLNELGLYNSSLIFFTADHGEEFFEHGAWGHGHTLYNELLRIPLIVKLPNHRAEHRGALDARLASSMDVLPTIRDVLGANWAANWSAPSLLSEIDDRRSVSAYKDQTDPRARTMYLSEQKVIQMLDPSGGILREELYCLDSDPREKDGKGGCGSNNMLWSEIRAGLARDESLGMPSEKVEMDSETEEELRSLGYIQ
ncbi:MAG: sulfatase [Vicinamibacteria bacterium]